MFWVLYARSLRNKDLVANGKLELLPAESRSFPFDKLRVRMTTVGDSPTDAAPKIPTTKTKKGRGILSAPWVKVSLAAKMLF